MKVLIIDNNDSFTFNIKHYLIQFVSCVDVIRYDKIIISDVNNYDKIIFSPGPGLPSDYPVLYKIIIKYEKKIPILGVCLGHQLIAEHYGATLENLNVPKHGINSKIQHFNNCSLYSNLPQNFLISHYHSWVVSMKNFPNNMKITAVNEDNLIMSCSHTNYNIKGVQFHPESILSEYGLELIENWIIS